MKGLGSGIKEFKNAAKDDQTPPAPSVKKKKKKLNKNLTPYYKPQITIVVWGFCFI